MRYPYTYIHSTDRGDTKLNLVLVISCGALPTPAHGRKSTFAFTPGTMVKFDCDPEFVLTGERRRWCYDDGDWNWAENGDAFCMRKCLGTNT